MKTQLIQGLVQLFNSSEPTPHCSLTPIGARASVSEDLLLSEFSNVLASLQPSALADDLAKTLPLAGQGLPHHDLKKGFGLDTELDREQV